MGETLTIRLGPEDRAALEEAARRQGTGLSAFIRGLAEAEARRLRREAALAEGKRVVSHLRSSSEARGELEDYGTPLGQS